MEVVVGYLTHRALHDYLATLVGVAVELAQLDAVRAPPTALHVELKHLLVGVWAGEARVAASQGHPLLACVMQQGVGMQGTGEVRTELLLNDSAPLAQPVYCPLGIRYCWRYHGVRGLPSQLRKHIEPFQWLRRGSLRTLTESPWAPIQTSAIQAPTTCRLLSHQSLLSTPSNG